MQLTAQWTEAGAERVRDLSETLERANPELRRALPAALRAPARASLLWRAAAIDWLVLVVCMAGMAYSHPLLYAPFALIAASRFHAFGAIVHELCHQPPQLAARYVGLDVAAGWPIAMTVASMRWHHLRHHRDSGMAADPYFVADPGRSVPRNLLIAFKAFLLYPFSFLRAFIGAASTVLPPLRPLYQRILSSGKADPPAAAGAELRECARHEVGLAAFQCGLLALTLREPGLMLQLWFGPLFVAGMLAGLRLRREHRYVANADRSFATIVRTTANHSLWWPLYHFVAPHNLGYHVVHHLHPRTGYDRLPALEAWYREQARRPVATPADAPLEIRPAHPDDDAALCAFFKGHAMGGAVQIAFDRSPRFAGLPACHAPAHETWVALHGGRLCGTGSYVVRDGYVDGAVEPVAYVGDLRVAGPAQLHRALGGLLQDTLQRVAREHGARYAYGCIVRGNTLARASLLRNRRGDKPALAHWRGYRNVLVLGRWPRWRRPAFAVRRATAADFPALRAFLDEQSRATALGAVFTAAELERRFDTWPGFGIGSFYLALDPAGRIQGCAAPWDSTPVKRIHLRMRPAWLHVLARATGLVDGDVLRTQYLSHLHVRDRDPRVLDALLHRIVGDLRRPGGFASLCVFDDDPLAAALRHYATVQTPMDLYVIRLRSDAPPLPAQALPGFEIALV